MFFVGPVPAYDLDPEGRRKHLALVQVQIAAITTRLSACDDALGESAAPSTLRHWRAELVQLHRLLRRAAALTASLKGGA
jgi:hypothetical protein